MEISSIPASNPSATAILNSTGRMALVIGGSSGLGRRFAQVLSAAGASIAICVHRHDHLEEAAAERIVPFRYDVTAVAAMRTDHRQFWQ